LPIPVINNAGISDLCDIQMNVGGKKCEIESSKMDYGYVGL